MVGNRLPRSKDPQEARPSRTARRSPPCTVPGVVVVTGTAQKEAWDRKILPPVEQVRPGLWSIPVPIPNNPLRYVLVYALELDGGGVALVDAGWNTEEAWSALSDGLAQAGGSIADVRAVMVTHIHPDHYGLAGRVREESGAWIGLHPADAIMLESRYGNSDELLADMLRFLTDSGVPEDKLPDLTMASMAVKSMVTMAAPDVLFEDGLAIDLPGWPLRTIWTPGHSPGPCLLLQRGAEAAHLRRPRAAPDHPEHLGAHPAGPQSAGRLPRVAVEGPEPGHRRGAPGPRVPVRRPRRGGSRRSSTTMPTGSRRSSR